MSLFPEFSGLPAGRAVLLSIKPRYADLILAGSKRVELRRSWPLGDIGVLVLYSSAPVQRLVGIAHISTVNKTDLAGLWKLTCEFGGGVTHDELAEYLSGKSAGFGIMIKDAKKATHEVDPKDLFPDFTPPQSYQYLTPIDFHRIMEAIFPEENFV